MQHKNAGYHFLVEWGGNNLNFTEVSGLSMQTEVVEYREGGSPENNFTKIAGLAKYANVILKRGIAPNDAELYNWFKSVESGNDYRRDVVIKLLNQRHEPIVSWKLTNAWPCRFDYSPLQAGSGEIVMESVELAHEGLRLLI